MDGKIEKFYKEACLLEQAYARDPNKTVNDLIGEAALQMREKIDVRRFTRYQMGERTLDRKGPVTGDEAVASPRAIVPLPSREGVRG